MQINNTCIITPTYPDPRFIERGAFVERLVRVWESLGVSVDVVAPRRFSNLLRSGLKKRASKNEIAGNRVLYPVFLSFSNKQIGGLDLQDLSNSRFLKASLRGASALPLPDLFYGQFLLTGGAAASAAGRRFGRPAFIDVGESVLTGKMSEKECRKAGNLVRSIDGLVCVSEELADEVIELGANPEKVFWHPNTVDLDRFYPRERVSSRKQLGLPPDVPIVVFAGHFIERKGPLRVLKAIQSVDRKVNGVFLGRGDQRPRGEHVFHTGPVPNHEMPLWYSAADLFVLPTLHEGHCNVINEAMACGLPIISSDIPEIRDQVPPDAGILVDPASVDQISKAIEDLLSDLERRKRLSARALELQRKRSAKSRASHIFDWISARLTSEQIK